MLQKEDRVMPSRRYLLSRLRDAGRRLVAQDQEYLHDMEQDEAIYCYQCQVQFALPSAEVAMQDEARERHYRSHSHIARRME